MGFFTKKAVEKRASEPVRTADIVEDIFDDSEKWGTKMLGAVMDYTNGAVIGEFGEDEVRLINMGIDYWKYLREMCLAWAEKTDKEHKALVHDNEILRQQLENQREALLEMRVMLKEMNDSINDKSIVVKKGDKKAE